MRATFRQVFVVCTVLLCAPQAPAADSAFEVELRPVRDGGTEVTAIEVRSVLHGMPDAGEPFSLTAPIVYAATTGIADRVENLEVTDRRGRVELAIEDDTPVKGGFPYYRHWRAERAVEPPVTISYRSAVQPVGAPNGPPFGIRPAAGGVSGAGSGFLVIPEGLETAVTRVQWDLGDLASGSIAASSFGDGDFTIEGGPAQLIQSWFMAGPAGRYPESGDANGFSATWLGTPPWDPLAEMQFAADVYAYLGDFFPHLDPAPRYRVFIRILETRPYGGGTALTNSFMLSRGPARADESSDGPDGLFFHEMIHQFVGGIEGPVGVTSWFAEGLTSYYTTQLQFRGGFHSIEEYGEDINGAFRRYWTSPARNWSAERIVETGFGDEAVRHTPYVRGHLYFADLDARIRAASEGSRSLDTVLRELFARREAGETFDRAAWIDLVNAEAGAGAGELFQSVILDGETIVPASNAFGPCFERRTATLEDDGETVEGFEWVRSGELSDAECRAWADSTSKDAVTAEISLHPVRESSDQVTAVEVAAVYRGTLPGAQAFSLTAPIVYAGRTGMADAVDHLVVTDATGAVKMRIENDPVNPGGFPYFRHWRAEREVVPPVHVAYRMRPAPTPLRGPQFDFYAHGGGISSGGMALFVLPENLGTANWLVTWNLSDLAPGSITASTHGEGDLVLTGPADRLIQAYYMAGPLGRYASPAEDPSFFAYWLGRTAFDAPAEMAWAAEAYEHLSEFYGGETPPYNVFVRAVPAEHGLGGTALGNSFMVGVPAGAPDPDATSPRSTIFHEMGHMFVGGLAGEQPGAGSWFAEGLNVHYTRRLLLASGLAPVGDYLDSINSSAGNYYASPYRDASADELFRIGFSTGIGSGSAQNIAYTRGSLYFAAVDSRIRSASNGKLNLDDVILPLFAERRSGEPLTRATLVDALAAAAGTAEREAFAAGIIDGELVVPPSDAFGPCFERRATTYGEGEQALAGYEWERIPEVPEEACRTW